MDTNDRVEYLVDCANSLDENSHVGKLLKSVYITTSRIIAGSDKEHLSSIVDMTGKCPRCCLSWNQKEFQVKSESTCEAKKLKTRRLITRLESNKKNNEKSAKLTKTQRKRAKWLKKCVTRSRQMICEFCHYKVVLPLPKCKKIQPKDTNTNARRIEHVNVKKKNKKKSKDLTAGLKISAPIKKAKKLNPQELPVQQLRDDIAAGATLTKLAESDSKTKKVSKKSQDTLKLITIEKLPQNSSVKVQKSTVPPVQSKIAPKKIPPSKIEKKPPMKTSKTLQKQDKSKKKQLQNKQKKVQPIVSKTQQKNSILKLAAMLKAQAAKSSVPAKKGLEAFLK